MVGYLTKSATTRLMKKILRESYPGIEFTVRAHKCGICIESTDGPAFPELHELFPRFCCGNCVFQGQPCGHKVSYALFEGKIVWQFWGYSVTRKLSKEVENIAFPLMPDGLLARRRPDGEPYVWPTMKEEALFDSVVDPVLAKLRPRQYSPTLALVDVVPNADCHEEYAAKNTARKSAAQEREEIARHLRSRKPRRTTTVRI